MCFFLKESTQHFVILQWILRHQKCDAGSEKRGKDNMQSLWDLRLTAWPRGYQCCVFLCAVSCYVAICCVVCALPHETRMKCLRWVWFQLIIEKHFATFNVRRTKTILTKYHIISSNFIFCIEYQKAIQLKINSHQSYITVLMIDYLDNIWDDQGNTFRFSKPISLSKQIIMLLPIHTGEK